MKDMSNLASLVTRIRAGDANTFDTLYRETYNTVYFHAKSILKHEEDALDIVQETYLTAYSTLDTLEQPEAVQAWLCKMASYKAFNLLRSRKHESGLSPDDDDALFEPQADANDEPEYVIDRAATQEIVADMIRALPEEQRTALMLYYYDELSLAEIAQAMSCSVNTVKSRLFYARKAVGAQVRAEEKQGVKLYSAAPVLLAAMRLLAQENTLAPAAAARLGATLAGKLGYGAAAGAVAGAAGAAAAGTAAGTASAGAAAGAAGASISAKVIAGVLAAALAVGAAVGGGIALHKKHAAQDEDASPAAQVEVQREEKPVAASLSPEQAKAYYDVLADISNKIGISEHNADVTGLAYAELIDFDGDGSPELYLYYADWYDQNNKQFRDGKHLYEQVWAWDGSNCQCAYQAVNMPSQNIRFEKSVIEVDGKTYLASYYPDGFNAGDSELVELLPGENGSFTPLVFQASPDDTGSRQAQELQNLKTMILDTARGHADFGPRNDPVLPDDIEWETNDVLALMASLLETAYPNDVPDNETAHRVFADYVRTVQAEGRLNPPAFSLTDTDGDGVDELIEVIYPLNSATTHKRIKDQMEHLRIYKLAPGDQMIPIYEVQSVMRSQNIGTVLYQGDSYVCVITEGSDGDEREEGIRLLSVNGYSCAPEHHFYLRGSYDWEEELYAQLDDEDIPLSEYHETMDTLQLFEMMSQEAFLDRYGM